MKGTSKNSQICPQRAAVGGNAETELFRISSPRRKAEPNTFKRNSKLSRPPPVTGAAYIGTLQNRTCFKGETGWLRNIICPSLRGADFFYVKSALTHETYFLFQAVDLKPKHYFCFSQTTEFTTDEKCN